MAQPRRRPAQSRAGTRDAKANSPQTRRASSNRRTSASKPTNRSQSGDSPGSSKASSGSRGSSGGRSARANSQSRSSARTGTRGTGARSAANAGEATGNQLRAANSNGKAAEGHSGLKSVVLPIATAMAGAAAGAVGGVLLDRKNRPRRKFLGVPIPTIGGNGTDKLARQIGEAAGQLSHLASEVHAAREQAAKIGKALS